MPARFGGSGDRVSDVFISYARSTEREAKRVADALRALGYGVWRDDELPAHRSFADVIEERLKKAKAVVVLWSKEAAQSEWVQSEADRARAERKLVQLTLDGAPLPMPFDRIQCANLVGWSGDLASPGWIKVAASVAELIGAPAAPAAAAPSHAQRAPAGRAEPLLAVLAFDNLSGDPEMAYFSDGVSEEIQETVAKGAQLKVIGRASSFQFRGADKAAARVGAELGASHVLDGSVRRSGPRVRISAQLVECAGSTTLWSDRFDRELTDIFELQDEIAAAVAAALKKAFAPPSQAQTIDPAAYDLYLRAREHKFTSELAAGAGLDAGDPSQAVPLYEQAVALAPAFASAWAGLAIARVYQIIYGQGEGPYEALHAGVAEAASTALRLDPACGTAYVALSLLEPPGCYLQRAALLDKALSASPNDTGIIAEVGRLAFIVGRHRESLARARVTYAANPLVLPAAYALATQTGAFGFYEESKGLFDAFRARWPTNSGLNIMALNTAAWNADWDRFEALVKSIQEVGLDGPQITWAIRTGRALRHGDEETVASLSRGLRSQVARTGTVRLDSLFAASELGLTDEAFQAAEAASFAHIFEPQGPLLANGWSPGLLFMGHPNRAMIQDARFVGLCARLGLGDYWVESGKWPDCADDVAYDFRAEARRLAGGR